MTKLLDQVLGVSPTYAEERNLYGNAEEDGFISITELLQNPLGTYIAGVFDLAADKKDRLRGVFSAAPHERAPTVAALSAALQASLL